MPATPRHLLFVLPLSLACLAMAASLTGCGDHGSASRTGPGAQAGAPVVVENAQGVWRTGDELVVGSKPVLQIGDGERPEYQFHGVAGAVRLSDGRIVVGDAGSSQVRIYTSRGDLVTTAGRAGAGPEEFRRMVKVEALPGDSVVVYDAGNRRLSVLTPQATFARLATPTGVGPGSDLVGVLQGGWFIFGVQLPVAPREGLSRDSIRYVKISPDGQAVDTLGTVPGGERFQRMAGSNVVRLTVPWGPTEAAAARGEHVFVGASDEYEIRHYGPGERPSRLIRRSVERKPFTQAHFDAHLESFPQYREALREIPRPRHLPVFAAFVADRSGNLWVQDYPDPAAGNTPWTLFSPEGVMLGPVALPANFRPTDIGSDYLLGVWMDSLGVEHIRLYSLRKPRS